MRKIDIFDADVLAGTRIIKAKQFKALVRASDIVAETYFWSEVQKKKLADGLEFERNQAFSKAYSDGLEKFISAIEQYATKTIELEDHVIDLLHSCLLRVLSSLPEEDVLYNLISPIFKDLRSRQEILVLVHPKKLSDLKSALERATTKFSDFLTFTARADTGVAEADCLIYTEEEVFKVSIPLTCDLLCKALTEYRVQERLDAVRPVS